MKSASEVRLAGLGAVRITWATAIVVCVLAIVSGLFSDPNGRNSSRDMPGFAFTDGDDPSVQLPELASFDRTAALGGNAKEKAQKAETSAPQGDRSQPADQHRPGDSHSGSRVPDRSGSQPPESGSQEPENAGGRAPSSLREPTPPEAPSVSVNVQPPPQETSVSVQSQSPPQETSVRVQPPPQPTLSVSVSASVETPVVKDPTVSVELP